jgi:transposase-like protein
LAAPELVGNTIAGCRRVRCPEAKGVPERSAALLFGAAAVLQRCQWHKRENVVSYLPEKHRPAIRRKLQAAYEHPTYDAASRALKQVRQELRLLNASALTSLEEGLEETLTLHRLGVFRELGISLKTTNLLESIHARIEARVQKVDHWRNSDQKQRWLATALLDLEPQLAGSRTMRHFRCCSRPCTSMSRRGRSRTRKPGSRHRISTRNGIDSFAVSA